MIAHDKEIVLEVNRSDLIYLKRVLDSAFILLEEVTLNDPAIEKIIEDASDGGDIMIELTSAVDIVDGLLK